MGRFVGFRLRAKEQDRDIEKDLERFTNESVRMREAYLIAMAVERGEYVKVSSLSFQTGPSEGIRRSDFVHDDRYTSTVPTKATPLAWNDPDTVWAPSAKPAVTPADGSTVDVRKNMLGGF